MNGEQVLAGLLAGNRRFADGQPQHPRQSPEQRRELAAGQRPVAAVLTCFDSRVAPEIVFDQGLGDLLVVRVAGNSVDGAVLGSLEFAAEAAGVPLIAVMGHDHCAAVATALQDFDPGARLPEAFPLPAEGRLREAALGQMLTTMRPALERARGQTGDAFDNAINANIRYALERLRSSPLIAARLAEKRLTLAGLRYRLSTGRVEVIDELVSGWAGPAVGEP